MGHDSTTLKISQLTERNYYSWKVEVRSVLVLKGLWNATQENETHDAIEDAEDQREKVEKAKAVILMNISAKLRGLVVRCNTAKEMWDLLKTSFTQQSGDRRIDLHHALASAKQKHNESVMEFCLRVEDLRAELEEGCDESVSDYMMIGILLAGVHQGFIQTVEAMRNRSDASLAVVKQALMSADTRRKGSESESNAKALTLGSKFKRTPEVKQEKRKCYLCDQVGHLKRDCPQNKERNKGSGGGRCLTVSNKRLCAESEILLDTCASHHMVSNKACFETLEEPLIASVTCGGGEQHKVLGVGRVTVITSRGPVQLPDTLYIPTLKANVLSGPVAMKNGAKLRSVGTSMEVAVNGHVWLQASATDGMMVIDGWLKKYDRAFCAAVDARTWHRRLGHISDGALNKMRHDDPEMQLRDQAKDISKDCDVCLRAKQTRTVFEDSKSHAKELLELVHSDLMGPMEESIGGSRYALTIMDDFSRYSEVVCLNAKGQAASAAIKVLTRWQRTTGKKLKTLRTDNGTEFKGILDRELKRAGVKHELSVRYTPQQNSRAERLNRTLMDRTRAMLIDAGLPKGFWAEALTTANVLRNQAYSEAIQDVPSRLFNGKLMDKKQFKIFGCVAYAQIPKEKRRKLDERSERALFVGYATDSKAWRLMKPKGNRWIPFLSRDVHFIEERKGYEALTNQHVHGDVIEAFENVLDDVPREQASATQDDDHQTANDGQGNEENQLTPEHVDVAEAEAIGSATEEDADEPLEDAAEVPPAGPDETTEQPEAPRYPTRSRNPTYDVFVDRFLNDKPLPGGKFVAQWAMNSTGLTDDPQTLEEVRARPDSELWEASINSELSSLASKGTYDLVDQPSGVKVIASRWVFKVKRDERGQVDKYKTRLVAKGFMQRFGDQGTEVFAPTSNLCTLRVLLALAANQDLDVQQIDVKTAFLNGVITDDVYIKCPPGFEVPGKVWKLRKALYGLKQAALAWYETMKTAMIQSGFILSEADPCLFTRGNDDDKVYVLVHVDDCLLVGKHAATEETKKDIGKLFEIEDRGAIRHFLGMEVLRDYKQHRIWVGQRHYVLNIIERFKMTDCKPRVTPFEASKQLEKEGTTLSDEVPYRELVGSLLYLCQCTRPDIAHSVGMLSRYMSNPTKEHWEAAKSVVRYLSATHELGLMFEATSGYPEGYSDSDYGGDTVARRSTSGNVFIYGGAAVAWSSKLQTVVATSTCEAELIAFSFAVKEALHISKILVAITGKWIPLQLHGDNQAAVALAKNPSIGAHNRTKHLDICYHFCRYRAMVGDVTVVFMPTQEMMADILTKQLPGPGFKKHRDNMGLAAPWK